MGDQQLHDADFFAWANQQAGLLRAGRLADADIGHIADEIESMGETEKRELAHRLTVLLLHLLRWQYQPVLADASWRATIRVQRRDLTVHMADNPSLESVLAAAIEQAYGNAVIEASAHTGLVEEEFPASCPWSYEAFMDPDFWPDVA